MNGKHSLILSGTNLGPQLLEIQVGEVTQNQYKNICGHCYNQEPFKSTFESPRACKSMRVSPSVWLQGWSGDRSVSKLSERTSSKLLSMISSIFLGILVMLIASILSSCLVITIIQKYLKLILEFPCLLIA